MGRGRKKNKKGGRPAEVGQSCMSKKGKKKCRDPNTASTSQPEQPSEVPLLQQEASNIASTSRCERLPVVPPDLPDPNRQDCSQKKKKKRKKKKCVQPAENAPKNESEPNTGSTSQLEQPSEDPPLPQETSNTLNPQRPMEEYPFSPKRPKYSPVPMETDQDTHVSDNKQDPPIPIVPPDLSDPNRQDNSKKKKKHLQPAKYTQSCTPKNDSEPNTVSTSQLEQPPEDPQLPQESSNTLNPQRPMEEYPFNRKRPKYPKDPVPMETDQDTHVSDNEQDPPMPREDILLGKIILIKY